MKCTNNGKFIIIVTMISVLVLTGCGQLKYSYPYDANLQVSSFNIIAGKTANTAKPFARDLCVVDTDFSKSDLDMSKVTSAVLFDLNDKETMYAKNAHERLNPASLTKIMTTLVALKYGSLDQLLVATESVIIHEPGAQLCGLKPGDQMTLDQALHILLLYSANDVAMMIAENIGVTVDHFVELMNEEAKNLGATNTNFANPHGLTQPEHYTTAYDLYLIFNEAVNYDKFVEMIHTVEYQTKYIDAQGREKPVSYASTNRFFRGDFAAPDNVNIIGGKTGTTKAAGHCLILLSKDNKGNPYISVILQGEDSDALYTSMVELLDEIDN